MKKVVIAGFLIISLSACGDAAKYRRGVETGKEIRSQENQTEHTHFTCRTTESSEYDSPTSEQIDNYRRTWGSNFPMTGILSKAGPAVEIKIDTHDSALVADLIKVCAGARVEMKKDTPK